MIRKRLAALALLVGCVGFMLSPVLVVLAKKAEAHEPSACPPPPECPPAGYALVPVGPLDDHGPLEHSPKEHVQQAKEIIEALEADLQE